MDYLEIKTKRIQVFREQKFIEMNSEAVGNASEHREAPGEVRKES